MAVYALKHPDGRWLYCLPQSGTGRFASDTVTGAFADGQPMAKLHDDWWSAAHEASRLTTTSKVRAKNLGYRLNDSAVTSVRYPASLTREQFSERVGDSNDDGDTLYSLYSGVYEQQPDAEHVYDGPVVVLEGREPPAPGEPKWIADLPHMLAERAEYRHLFPGHIPGLVDRMMRVFETMPRVEHVFLNFQNQSGVYVSLRVPYDEPRTEWRAYTGRNGQKLKSGRTVPVRVARSLTLPIVDRVAADSYADALTAWEQQVAYWTGVVESASVAACSHCDGRGYVADGSEQYSRSTG